MKNYFLLILLFFIQHLANSQDNYTVFLKNKSITIENQQFSINQVVDKRMNKSNIGYTKVSLKNVEKPILFNLGFENSITLFYASSLDKKETYSPADIYIREFKVWEKTTEAEESSNVHLVFDFFLGNYYAYTSVINSEIKGNDASSLIEKNIQKALTEAVLDFDKTYWKHEEKTSSDSDSTVTSDTNYSKITDQEQVQTNEKLPPTPMRFARIIGYQIGGYTLIGFDIEARLDKVIGIHAGVGLYGYTIGTKFHFTPDLHGPLINLSYKDLGLGQMSVLAAEYSGTIHFRNESGLVIQFGLAQILKINNEISQLLFKGKAPPMMLSMGIGIGF